jgi:hypothetical protein
MDFILKILGENIHIKLIQALGWPGTLGPSSRQPV